MRRRLRALFRIVMRRRRQPSPALVAHQRAVASARRSVAAAERAAATAAGLDAPLVADAELVLTVAEVFPHEGGQQMWWESFNRRSPKLQRELVDDLRRRQARNAAGGSSRQG